MVKSKLGWDSESTVSSEEVEVLHMEDNKQTIKPFVLNAKINVKPFHALIDTGIPHYNFQEGTHKKIGWK